jgi:transmembrane sensor
MVWRATRPDPGTASLGPVASAARTYETAARQIDTLRLADGSTVVLGPSSRLVLGEAFGSGARETALEGQAYFDVVHDDARPFVVYAARATLRDIGTTFAVRSDSVLGTRVAVSSGAVDVVATAGGSTPPTVLHAGDRAEVTRAGMRVERGTVTDDELSWTRGVLEFRDASLASVAQELRRWHGVHLVVTDSTIANRRVTATFERAGIDDVARVLAAVVGGSMTRSGDTLLLGAPERR